jgi:SAM-dependent methyltransferase
MNNFLEKGNLIIELGCGAEFSTPYLDQEVILTDTSQHNWVHMTLDATKMALSDESVDVIIASRNIHHFSSPYNFLLKWTRVLKPGGRILIQEINTSLMMRILIRLMRYEGWSYDVDVFDPNSIANDPNDPWSANCAIPYLIFESSERFHLSFPSLRIVKNQKCDGLIFPLSGGAEEENCKKKPRTSRFATSTRPLFGSHAN